MHFTGQNNGGTASSAFLLARKCNWLARTCIMNMRNVSCVRTQTSKVPTWVALLFISYSMLKLCIYDCESLDYKENEIYRSFLMLVVVLSRFSTWRICSREQAKNECDWLVMTSVFVTSQSSCFFLCSREQTCQVENRFMTTTSTGKLRYISFSL